MALYASTLLLFLTQLVTSTPLTQPFNATNGLTANCLTSDKFTRKGWIPVDCYAASYLIYNEQVRQGNPDVSREFYPIGTPPSSRTVPLVLTPKKFTVNSCNIAIVTIDKVMRKLWRSDLPGIKGISWPPTEHSTYRHVYEASLAVKDTCSATTTAAWVQFGDYGGLGLFVWATGSWMDENFSLPYLGGEGRNETEVVSMPSNETE